MGLLDMFMKKEKAFTLAELMMVFVVIGIIASIAVVTIKPFEKSVKYLYYRMYNVINTAIYNAMFTRAEFPVDSNDFCTALLEFINSNENHCDIARNVSLSDTEYPEDKVQIFASNGVRLYIAANADGSPFTHTEVETSGISVTYKYFVVIADLNAEKGPNTAQWKENEMADIVAFVVTDSTEVVPVGYPEVDTRYMFARVVYPPVDDDPESNLSEAVSYYEAKNRAWGSTIDSAEAMSFNFQDDFPADSPFKLPPEAYPTPAPSLDFSQGCLVSNSPCYVKIEEYE